MSKTEITCPNIIDPSQKGGDGSGLLRVICPAVEHASCKLSANSLLVYLRGGARNLTGKFPIG